MKHPINVPPAGESINEAYIGSWHKKSGDQVQKGEVLVDLETQKASFEIEAEVSGVLNIIKAEPNTEVEIGELIGEIETEGSTAEDAAPVKKEKPAESAPAKAEPAKHFSPAARKMAKENNLNETDFKNVSGKNILKEDVAQLVEEGVPAKTNTMPQPAAKTKDTASDSKTKDSKPKFEIPELDYKIDEARGEKIQRATLIRREIAKNLVKAKQTAAILTTFNEVDMTEVMAYRKKNKEALKEKYGVAPGMVGFFAMAAKNALLKLPMVNATFTGQNIVTREFVDISIAVSTDQGLVVPVIRDVQKMGLIEFEKGLGELSEKARNKKLSIAEMTGGTFTISNGGVFGSMLSTPILNIPQSAILGLHKIEKRAVVIDDKIVIRPMMYLALSYDHRIIDGKDAVTFLVEIKNQLEDLSLLELPE